jgi:hypothetical protein
VSRKTALAAAFAATVLSLPTWAQVESATRSRAEVKAETRAAVQAGQLTPGGEGRPADATPTFKSSKTRAERMEETLQARRDNQLIPASAADLQTSDAALRAQRSSKTRGERKAETQVAISRGELVPAGEGFDAPRK